ncbi:hypothetical protein GQ43DRAFT_361553 [Delitschia confertaspora ATCC 74209]|uniref:Uncharacterized protein n=1 Tax=Delitschia confertaspora ATCC 74209 TaxID=1513339 RepID=A0A9P4MTY3_9PLEO|nr:hypothetical protein GQ43DRAFT_361553 [Delitschia confertaspora ATCC 74209]
MSGLLSTVTGTLTTLGGSFENIIDRFFPPEKRAELWTKLQNFAINNPKLAAFLTTHLALTSLPIFLFACFTLTVFIFSLLSALLIGVLVALVFTVAMVFVALLVVLPTIFMTSFAASFLFLWGLGGYKLFKWLNEGKSPAPEGAAIGDKLNGLSGGRLGWLMDGVRGKTETDEETQEKNEKMNGGDSNDHHTEQKGHHTNKKENRSPKKLNGAGGLPDVQKQVDEGKGHVATGKEVVAKGADGVTKRVNKGTGGATGNATNAVGVAKGAVGGVAGL